MAAPLPPVDPDVKLPPSVQAQVDAANAVHASAYTAEPQPVEPPAPPAPVASEAAPEPPPVSTPPASTAPAAPAAPEPPAAADDTNLTADQWRHRYLSMEGRYKQAATTIGGLQEQMQELGDELIRTQRVARNPHTAPTTAPLPGVQDASQPLVTEQERQLYGEDLIDVVKRAAREAVAPDLAQVQHGVQQVQQRQTLTAQQRVHQQLAASLPDWVTINRSPRFRQWCSLRDVYSGQVRMKLLNEAFRAADAPRVVQFFKGFLAEEQATGQITEQPQPAAQAPRIAAVPLDNLTAPGRAKPASGDTAMPVDKPIYTREQIKSFYADVRRQAYAGRETEKAAMEQAIFLAQREGRVRG